MSCECHSSLNGDMEQLTCNNYKNSIFTRIQLTNENVQAVRSFDTFHLIFYDHEFNVTSMFLRDLSYLFPRLPSPLSAEAAVNQEEKKHTIKIVLSFPNFLRLHFEDYSFYQLFNQKSDYTTILTLELTSNGQITFSPAAFSELVVDQLFMHTSSLEPYTFEEIFNNTHIGELALEGSAPRSNETLRQNFNGKIRQAKFAKMVETVSNEEFPPYPVRSMIIEAHEARKLNASAFMNYRNLHGLRLIRPKFFFDNRTLDGLQYVVSLEVVELDAETIKDNTFQHASRIRFLSLGQNIRYLSEHALDYLDYLIHFDASKVVLDQLYPSSRCVLARFIRKQRKLNPSIIISPPQAEYCDCIYDFILSVLNRKADQFYIDLCSDNQQERCELSQCSVVKNFRLAIQEISSSTDDITGNGTISLHPNDNGVITTNHQSPSYVHRHPPVHHQSHMNNEYESIRSTDTEIQDSYASALKANDPIDPNAILPFDDDETVSAESPQSTVPSKATVMDEQTRLALKNESLKWIAISLICITILCLLLVGTLIWFFTCRPSSKNYKAGFQPVSPNSSNV